MLSTTRSPDVNSRMLNVRKWVWLRSDSTVWFFLMDIYIYVSTYMHVYAHVEVSPWSLISSSLCTFIVSSPIWLCWLGSKLYQSTRLHSSSVSSMNQYSTTPSFLPRGWGSELRFSSFRCKHFPNGPSSPVLHRILEPRLHCPGITGSCGAQSSQ